MAEAHTSSLSLGISPEEFEQYQRQFIEERSEKYALLEKVRKLEQDLARLSSDKGSERDFDKLIKDKLQKPFQTFLSRTKRESESSELIIQQENDALQKRLHSQEDDFQRQNILLMQELQSLTIRNEELERKINSPSLQNSGDATKREELEAKIRSLETELIAFRNLTSSRINGPETESTPISDTDRLMVDLASANEEIRTLKMLLESNKKSYEATIIDQEKTVANLIRDLEGKQSSVQLLLSERDQLQRAHKDLIAASAADREKILSAYKSEKSRLLEENHELRQAVEDERVICKTRAEDVERQMKDLLEQMDVTGQQTKRDSDELLQEHKQQIASLLHEMEILKEKNCVLEKSELENRKLAEILQEEKIRFVAEENELTRLVEKRKATIDDLTNHLSNFKQKNEEEKEKTRLETTRLLDALTQQLKQAQAEAVKVAPLQLELDMLNNQLRDSLIEKEKLAKDLDEKTSDLEKLRSVRGEEMSQAKRQLDEILADSAQKHGEISDRLERILEERDETVKKMSIVVDDLEQRLRDRSEELKIVEKKNAGMSRDLQKQLQVEKKHVEKLQKNLNEILRDGNFKNKIADDSADFSEREETGSVSSWSFVSSRSGAKKLAGHAHSDGASINSNAETETGTLTGMTEEEVRDLVTRMTKLQQEKASLLERVSMLETGNAAMAQDLINKSAVIDRYLQATPVLGHHGHLSSKEADAAFSLRSLIDRLGRDKTMDVETQKNLRHLLEETLTKNVHLQKNMELLTEELDRLRGSTPPRV